MGVFKVIKELQKEQNQVELDIARNTTTFTEKIGNRECEVQIRTVFNDHENRPLMEFFRGIVHSISF